MQTIIVMRKMLMAIESPSKVARDDLIMVAVIEAVLISKLYIYIFRNF